MPIRRVVLDLGFGMAVFWNTQPVGIKRRSDRAVDRFDELRHQCEDIPKDLTRMISLNPRKVRYLPFREEISGDISDVLLYGPYGGAAKVACWNVVGELLPEELSQGFLPPTDVANLSIIADLVLIGTAIEKLYCLPNRRTT